MQYAAQIGKQFSPVYYTIIERRLFKGPLNYVIELDVMTNLVQPLKPPMRLWLYSLINLETFFDVC